MNFEIYRQIGNSNACITYDPLDRILYLRKYILDEDECGGYYVKKLLPDKKNLGDITIRSPEIQFIFKKIKGLKDFDDINLDKFKVDMEEAIDNLVLGYREYKEESPEQHEQYIEDGISQETLALEGKMLYDELEKPLSHYLYTYFEYLYPGNGKKMLLMWLNALSTARGNPAGVIVKGEPGEGKTVLMEHVLATIPEYQKIDMQNGTKSALFGKAEYLGNDYLDRKIVYLGDLGAGNALENTNDLRQTLRTLMTDGFTNPTLRDPEDKKTVLDEILEGKPSMWYTTVNEDAEDQEIDRSITFTPNLMYRGKVRYIMKVLKTPKKSKTGRFLTEMKEEWIPFFQSIFAYLSTLDHEVIIPFDIENQEFRYRHIDKIMDIGSNMALVDYKFRQHQDNMVLLHRLDIEFALEFVGQTKQEHGKLSELQVKRLTTLEEIFGSTDFTGVDAKEIFQDAFKDSEIARSRLLKPGVNAKVLMVDESSRPYKYTFAKHQLDEANSLPSLPNIKVDYEYLKYEYNIKYEGKSIMKIGIIDDIQVPIYMRQTTQTKANSLC